MVKTGGMDTKKKTASTDAYHCLAQSFSAGHDVPQSGAPSTHPDFSPKEGATPTGSLETSPREPPVLSIEETLKHRLSCTNFEQEDSGEPDTHTVPILDFTKLPSTAESKNRLLHDLALRFKAKRVKMDSLDDDRTVTAPMNIQIKVEPQSSNNEAILREPPPPPAAKVVCDQAMRDVVTPNAPTKPPVTKPQSKAIRSAKDGNGPALAPAFKPAPKVIQGTKAGNGPALASKTQQAPKAIHGTKADIGPALASKPQPVPKAICHVKAGNSPALVSTSPPVPKEISEDTSEPISCVDEKARVYPRSPRRTFISSNIDRPDKSVDWYNLRDQDYTKLHLELSLDLYPLTKGYKLFTSLKYKYNQNKLQGVQERFLNVYGCSTHEEYIILVYRLSECRKTQLLLELTTYQELLDVKERLKVTKTSLQEALSQY